MKYLVLRDCYGFKGRFWHKDEIVELAENENPPHHFQHIEKEPEPKPAEKELRSFSEIQKAEMQTEEKPVGMRAKAKKPK
jgi:hypothetical protein